MSKIDLNNTNNYSPIVLLGAAGLVNKLFGLTRTLLLMYLVGESNNYSTLLSYIFLVQLFLIPFDYSFLNTLFIESTFEKNTLDYLKVSAILSSTVLTILLLVKGNIIYGVLSIIYFILSVFGSFSIIILNRYKYFKLYAITSIISSITLLMSVFFVRHGLWTLYLGRIISVLPVIIGLIYISKNINYIVKKISIIDFLLRVKNSLYMNKTTITMIILPLILVELSVNITYYTYAISFSGMVNSIIVRNYQLLTMSRIPTTIKLNLLIFIFLVLTLVSLVMDTGVISISTLDLVILLRYVFSTALLLLMLGYSDIKMAIKIAT